jgi:hypothetical protein
MSVYMRAVLSEWHDPPFEELVAFVADVSSFHMRAVGDGGWSEFEALDAEGTTVLAGDLTTGLAAREELAELEELLDDHDGEATAREAVVAYLRDASAVVGMQVLMSVHDASVAAANAIIDFLEPRQRVLAQVDTVGWYEGPDLILAESG